MTASKMSTPLPSSSANSSVFQRRDTGITIKYNGFFSHKTYIVKKKSALRAKNHPCQVTLRAGSPQEWGPRALELTQ